MSEFIEARNTQTEKLRAILEDGEWHYGPELAKTAGWRFGGAVERIRKALDKKPAWFIENEPCDEARVVWRYRFVGVNPDPPRPGSGWKGRALSAEKEIAVLHTQIAELQAYIRRWIARGRT
jgi:hypothetical protein